MKKHYITTRRLSFAIILSLMMGLVFAGSMPVAAEEIFLTADLVNSTASGYGGSVDQTLTDGFAYDPANPTSPMPATTWGSGGFHGNGTIPAIIAYNFDNTYDNITVDIYGRSECCKDRDNDFDVVFYRDGAVIETVSSLAIPDVGNTHLRVTATASTRADAMRLVCDNNGAFTIMEVRANGQGAIQPTMYSIEGGLMLLGLALLGYHLTRRLRCA